MRQFVIFVFMVLLFTLMTPDGEDPDPTIEPLDDYFNRYFG